MPSTIINLRDLRFLLYEWLDLEALCARERFSGHSREIFDAILDTALAILLFRSLLDAWNESATAIVVSIVIALIAVAPLTSVLVSLAISRFEGKPSSRRQAADRVSRSEASISVIMSASWNEMPWNFPMGWPNCFLSAA